VGIALWVRSHRVAAFLALLGTSPLQAAEPVAPVPAVDENEDAAESAPQASAPEGAEVTESPVTRSSGAPELGAAESAEAKRDAPAKGKNKRRETLGPRVRWIESKEPAELPKKSAGFIFRGELQYFLFPAIRNFEGSYRVESVSTVLTDRKPRLLHGWGGRFEAGIALPGEVVTVLRSSLGVGVVEPEPISVMIAGVPHVYQDAAQIWTWTMGAEFQPSGARYLSFGVDFGGSWIRDEVVTPLSPAGLQVRSTAADGGALLRGTVAVRLPVKSAVGVGLVTALEGYIFPATCRGFFGVFVEFDQTRL
jgi:hypothetical protein